MPFHQEESRVDPSCKSGHLLEEGSSRGIYIKPPVFLLIFQQSSHPLSASQPWVLIAMKRAGSRPNIQTSVAAIPAAITVATEVPENRMLTSSTFWVKFRRQDDCTCLRGSQS